MKEPDLIAIRDRLALSLRNVKGVVSVGIGRGGRGYVLMVVADSRRLSTCPPSLFEGIPVVVRDLGETEVYSWRRMNDARYRRSF